MARHIDLTKHSRPVRLAAHAIGLDYKRPYMRNGKAFFRPYRNTFTCLHQGPTYTALMELVEYGYAKEYHRNDGTSKFWLTRAGLDWLGDTLGITIYDEED